MKGIIVKGIAGFYYVRSGEEVYQCKARGVFKIQGITPCVGDEVTIEIIEDGDSIITDIKPRRNAFVRPPIANVDCFVIVVSVSKPEPNFDIIDRFLVMAEKNHTDIILCMNKVDLVSREKLDAIAEIYQGIYPMIWVSGATGQGMDQLKQQLQGKKCALAGPSGVGKSTLINHLQGNLVAETGEISEKTKRGKHTTRHVEIFPMPSGGMIFDTPGFTSFDILGVEEDELQSLYPEIHAFGEHCKYDNCRHIREPECKVRDAVDAGKIHASRYASYTKQYKEIAERKKY